MLIKFYFKLLKFTLERAGKLLPSKMYLNTLIYCYHSYGINIAFIVERISGIAIPGLFTF